MTLIETPTPTTSEPNLVDPTAAPVPTSTAEWIDLARTVGGELKPHAAEFDLRGELSITAIELLRERGITKALVPVEFGGPGAHHADAGSVIRELARFDPATALTLSMHTHVLAAQVWRHQHGLDASAVFGKVAAGAMLVSTGATDWMSSSGTVEPVDGGFRVSGSKAPASGCEAGDVFATSFRWDSHPDGPHVIHCSVPRSAEGVSTTRTWNSLGMRATGSDTVEFDRVFVPEAAVSLTRPADVWHPFWNVVMGAAMPLIMSAYLGVADALVERTIELRSGATAPHVASQVGEMINAHVTAADLVDGMFRLADGLHFDNVDAVASGILARKTAACEALLTCGRLALEAAGGIGYSRNDEIERLFRDLHGCVYHPLPKARQTQFTGRVALGLPPTA